MKTYKGWLKTDANLRDYIQPGDEVDEAMVDYFMNALPPRSMSYGYMQAGEPIKQCQDKDGRWKSVYITFAKEAGKWIYKGLCFPGEDEDKTNSPNEDPWRKDVES